MNTVNHEVGNETSKGAIGAAGNDAHKLATLKRQYVYGRMSAYFTSMHAGWTKPATLDAIASLNLRQNVIMNVAGQDGEITQQTMALGDLQKGYGMSISQIVAGTAIICPLSKVVYDTYQDYTRDTGQDDISVKSTGILGTLGLSGLAEKIDTARGQLNADNDRAVFSQGNLSQNGGSARFGYGSGLSRLVSADNDKPENDEAVA